MKVTSSKITPKRLLALTAADLMTAPVKTIQADTPIQEAARLMAESHITGAPVVDAEGNCIGVLSSSDFVTWVKQGAQPGERGKKTCFIAPWGEMIDIDEAPNDEIRRYMTTRPVSVAPDTPIGAVAQKMVEAHIHRVLVLREPGHPCGIISSTDVLAAISRTGH